MADHLAAARRRLGAAAVSAAGPPFPEALAHVWAWWLRLHRARGSSGFGPLPISWGEMDAAARVLREPLEPWEAAAVRAVDDAWLDAVAESRPGAPPDPPIPYSPTPYSPIPSRPRR